MQIFLSELAVLIFFFFLPGRAYLYFRKIDLSVIETLTLSICLGAAFFGWIICFVLFFSGLFWQKWLVILIIPAVDLFFIYQRLRKPKNVTAFLRPKWTKFNFFFVCFTIAGSIFVAYFNNPYHFFPFLALSSFILIRRIGGELLAVITVFPLCLLALLNPDQFIFWVLPVVLAGLFCFRQRLYFLAIFLLVSIGVFTFLFQKIEIWSGFLF